jgi:hypothetical protein
MLGIDAWLGYFCSKEKIDEQSVAWRSHAQPRSQEDRLLDHPYRRRRNKLPPGPVFGIPRESRAGRVSDIVGFFRRTAISARNSRRRALFPRIDKGSDASYLIVERLSLSVAKAGFDLSVPARVYGSPRFGLLGVQAQAGAGSGISAGCLGASLGRAAPFLMREHPCSYGCRPRGRLLLDERPTNSAKNSPLDGRKGLI